MPFLLLLSIVCLLAGPIYTIIYFIFLNSIFILGDLILPYDKSTPNYKYPWILNFLLFINLPLVVALYFVLGWYCSSIDIFSFGSWAQNNFSLNIIENRYNMEFYHYIFAILSSGLALTASGINVGHELVHRTNDRISKWVGNWLIAFTFDMAFAIEHVYGHHKNVCLKKDPATAQRGQSIYKFIISSTVRQFFNANKIEKRKGKKIYQNRVLISAVRSICIVYLMYLLGGIYGLLSALAIALIAKILLETVNYLEHYGLVRKERTKVYPRHSWNSNHFMSNIILYNLSRHSHHHEKAYVEFWDLKPYDDAPEMPHGYLSMIFIALLFPWWYHRIMAKKLIEWDNNYANEDEKKIAMEDNLNSGIRTLIQA
tara:strand:- start:1923 stop:3035 length:1113 start_codon:yes stop_codon:yes gene_type:complete